MNKIKLKNGEEIAYRENGTGNNILICLHGNMCSSFEFETLLKNVQKDFKIIAPDLRGFGDSSYNSVINNFEEYANDIIEFLDTLGVENFSLLGHYIGGAVALEIAAMLKTRVNKLLLVSSVGTLGYPLPKLDTNGQPIENEFLTTREEIENDVYRVLPIQQIFTNKDSEFLKGIFESTLFNVTQPTEKIIESIITDAFTQKSIVDVYCALANFNISNKSNGVTLGNNKIESITAETAVIQGSNDSLVPFDMAYLIKYSLRSKSKIVTGTFGHSPFLDTPNWISETIYNFINN